VKRVIRCRNCRKRNPQHNRCTKQRKRYRRDGFTTQRQWLWYCCDDIVVRRVTVEDAAVEAAKKLARRQAAKAKRDAAKAKRRERAEAAKAKRKERQEAAKAKRHKANAKQR
jgi:hypothetical protein